MLGCFVWIKQNKQLEKKIPLCAQEQRLQLISMDYEILFLPFNNS